MLRKSISDQYPGANIPLLPPSPSSFSATPEDLDCLRRYTDVTRKRKISRSVSETASCEHLNTSDRATGKRRQIHLNNLPQDCSGDHPARVTSSDNACDSPIQYWTQTGNWPKDFAQMSRERSASPLKRLRTSSHTQSVQHGEAPRAYSPAYEKMLAGSGVHMEESKGRGLVGQESRDRCTKMLCSVYDEPRYAMFALTSFLEVWERVRNRNEARIFRDITPLLVPSPELLVVNGHVELEYIVEELNAEWTKCKPMAGPRPKPDLAMGISSLAFTTEEMAKLQNHSSIERPTQFTENMYFPFLLCEVKSGDQSIDRADRQNMHSGSIACQAILGLERSAGENRTQKLSGEILVYSVSHNNDHVKIYGHFPVIQGEQTTFHRFLIGSFILNVEEGQGRKRTHDFVREVYRTVFPRHLQRVREALMEMGDPRDQPELGMSVIEGSAPSTQDTGTFKIPGTPASRQYQEEPSFIRDQLVQQERLFKEQISRQEKHIKELMEQREKEMAQREKEHKEQLDMFKALLNRQ